MSAIRQLSWFLEFRHPYLAVGLEIEADAHVAVVGVDGGGAFLLPWAPRVLADLAAGVVAAAAAHILAATATPQGGGTKEAEGMEGAIVSDGHHGLAAASGIVGALATIGVTNFAVFPSLGGTALGELGHVVAPGLSLVGRHMTGKESARLWVGGRLGPWGRWYVKLGAHLHSIIWS